MTTRQGGPFAHKLFCCLVIILSVIIPSHASQQQNSTILPPPFADGKRVAVVLSGRNDMPRTAYYNLAGALQATAAADDVSVWVVLSDLSDITAALPVYVKQYNISIVYFAGHSMAGGAVDVQNFIASNPHPGGVAVSGVVLLAGFLQRQFRPNISTCLLEWKVQPTISWQHPLGYLPDGVHTCTGAAPAVFPIPLLTVGGDLDGVVRPTRLAESYYNQLSSLSSMPVVILPGVNHAALLGAPLPVAVAAKDLPAEVTSDVARNLTARLVVDWMLGRAVNSSSSSDYFKPLVDAFLLEGSWWFTEYDEEHGSSPWAAQAQAIMFSPLPIGWSVHSSTNQFHLVSDEESIPPYYRSKHRANITLNSAMKTVNTDTVTQLRYLQLTPSQAGFGLNGGAIIKEEKVGVLNLVGDDGSDYVSSVTISTKMVSRQLLFNVTGFPSPDDLDSGSRCKTINSAAVDWAMQQASAAALARYRSRGVPLVLGEDLEPTIPAGPWWIWSYMQYTSTPTALNVSSYFAFYDLSANPYGAGNHYCHLLSPARVLEWIYVDSLRKT